MGPFREVVSDSEASSSETIDVRHNGHGRRMNALEADSRLEILDAHTDDTTYDAATAKQVTAFTFCPKSCMFRSFQVA